MVAAPDSYVQYIVLAELRRGRYHSGMELRHLRYFVAVAEELHFGRAARRLHMAQPPLSQQIRALESELGVTLFDRTQRSVALTAAGRVLLEGAYQTLALVDRTVQATQQAARGERGRLRIGLVSSAAFSNLPAIMRAFGRRAPEVTMELQELTTPGLLRALEEGAIDVGFFRLEEGQMLPEQAVELCHEGVMREAYVVALPEQHPLAARPVVPLADLAGEDFVMFPRRLNPGLHDLITRHCRAAGFEPHITQEATLMQTLVSLVAGGLGVTFIPASMEALRMGGVVYRPLAESGLETRLQAVWRCDDTHPVLQAFLATMREVVASA